MSQHPEIIAAPFTIWIAPVGTAFPAVDAEPSDDWSLLGSHGARSYSAGGIVLAHDRQYMQSAPPAGETASTVSAIEREGLRVRFELLDLTLEQYALVLGGNAITVQPAAYQVPGTRTIGLSIASGASREFAVLARGPSPYLAGLAAQFELPRACEVGSPQLTFSKAVAAGLRVDLNALPDPAATNEAERFGRLVAQFEPAGTTPPPPPISFIGSTQEGGLAFAGSTQAGPISFQGA